MGHLISHLRSMSSLRFLYVIHSVIRLFKNREFCFVLGKNICSNRNGDCKYLCLMKNGAERTCVTPDITERESNNYS